MNFKLGLIFVCIGAASGMEIKKADYEIVAGYFMRQGSRHHMEDIVTMLPDEEYGAFFGVYDGHSGKKTSSYAGKHLHKILNETFKSDSQSSIEAQFDKSFELVDKKLAELNIIEDGSTALVGLVQKDKLHLAWAGDSRAMIIRDGKVLLTTIDHKPLAEEERIKKAGGSVMVYENLARIRPDGFAMSRALGDLMYDAKKKKVMIVNPEVKTVFVAPGDTLLMATDGFWDDIPTNDACEKVKNYLQKNDLELKEMCADEIAFCEEEFSFAGNQRLQMITQLLCNEAVKAYPGSDGVQKNNCDNISVLLVEFKENANTKVVCAAPESAV